MTMKGESEAVWYRNLIEEHHAIPDVVEGSLCSCGKKLTLTYKERNGELPSTQVYEYLSENIYYCNLKQVKSEAISFSSTLPDGFVHMIFCLKGACQVYTENKHKLYEIQKQQHNLLSIADDKITYRIPAEDPLDMLMVAIRYQHFLKYALPQLPQVDSFNIKVLQKQFCQLRPVHFALSHKIALVIEQLLSEKAPEAIRYHFVEAKVAELLMLQLSMLLKPIKMIAPTHLREDEIEKMRKVKSILLRTMGEGTTLKSLAQEVGTNEYNLKKHFKMVFGQTVFGYLHTYKMETAKRMLLDERMKVADLSEKLGYKHATHFSAAFKKHFGYLPSER